MARSLRNAIPATDDTVRQLGAFIAIARKRRGWRQDTLASKAGIHPNTLRKVEAGEAGTAMGAYVASLWALGLLDQLGEVARPERDMEGELLSQVRLGTRARTSAILDDDF